MRNTNVAQEGQYVNLNCLSEGTGHPRRPVPQACFGYVCLNIEHSMKVQINRDFSGQSKGRRIRHCRGIFGKSTTIFFANCPKWRRKTAPIPFLYRRFLEEPALWNLTEVLSFGEFVTFLFIITKKFPPESPAAPLLQPVKYLRNASAHNNAMLNNMKPPEGFYPQSRLG